MATDLSHLPRAAPVKGGTPPVPHLPYGQAMADWLLAKRAAEDAEYAASHEGVERSRFSPFRSGSCSRALAYFSAGLDESNPMGLDGIWNTTLGSIVHDQLWQPAMKAAYGDACELEVPFTLDEVGGRGRADVVLNLFDNDDRPFRVVLEGKSVGGFGFKTHIGLQRDDPGPRSDALVQGSINGYALGADLVVLVDLAKECIGTDYARKAGFTDPTGLGRFYAEWHYTADEFMGIAASELQRIAGINRKVDEHGPESVKRFIPGDMPPGAQIVDPPKKRWELRSGDQVLDSGSAWPCAAYCSQRDRCHADWKAGR